MIRPNSRQLLATDVMEVERTPGGHFIRVAPQDGCWTGLYRFDDCLVLFAYCYGAPPRKLLVDPTMHSRLRRLIQTP